MSVREYLLKRRELVQNTGKLASANLEKLDNQAKKELGKTVAEMTIEEIDAALD